MRPTTCGGLVVAWAVLGSMTMSCAAELDGARVVAGTSASIISNDCTDACTLPLDEVLVGCGSSHFTHVQASEGRTVAAVLARSRSHGDRYGIGAGVQGDGWRYSDPLLMHGVVAVVTSKSPEWLDVVPIEAAGSDGGYYLQYRAFDRPVDLRAGGMLRVPLAAQDAVYARQVSLPPNHRVRIGVDLVGVGGELAVLLASGGDVHLLSTACAPGQAVAPGAAEPGYSCEQREQGGMQVMEFASSDAGAYDLLVVRPDYAAVDLDIRIDVL